MTHVALDFPHSDSLPVLNQEIGRFSASTSGKISRVDVNWTAITGLSGELAAGEGWLQMVSPQHRASVGSYWQAAIGSEQQSVTCEFLLASPEQAPSRWVRLIALPQFDRAGDLSGFQGTVADVTSQYQAARLLTIQRDILSSVALGSDLDSILTKLLVEIEVLAPALRCSVLLLSESGNTLHHSAAPRLASEYITAIDGVEIGPNRGSCGTAAFRGEEVMVEDIATDPLWEEFRHLALPHGLRSCWSTPLIGPNNEVIGTFGIYRSTPGQPTRQDRELIEMVSDLTTLAVVRDLELKKLRESERLLASAQRLANLGSWELDLRGGQGLKWSEQMYRIFNRTRLEGPPSPDEIEQVVHPDDRAQSVATRQRLLSTGVPTVTTFRTNPEHGPVRTLRATGAIAEREEGNPVLLSGVVQDITREVERDAALRAGEKKFRATFEQATMGIAHVGLDGKVIMANPSLEKMVGVSASEIIGKSLTEFSTGGATDADLLALEAMSAGTLMRFNADREFVRPDGSRVQARQTCTTVLDESGIPEYIASIIEDVTKQKALEAQLRQAHKMEAIGLLAGGVAHDFNNLLTVILGHADLAAASQNLDPVIREDLKVVIDAAERGAAVTKQLLTFARKDNTEPQLIVPHDTLSNLMPLLGKMVGQEIGLKADWLGGIDWSIMIDPSKWDQVLINLVSNSKDAISGGGTISLLWSEYSHPGEDTPQPVGLPRGDYLKLAVNDTGAGLDPKTLDHVFEPFFTTKPVGSGTGLGLSMALGVVQDAGGTITIDSKLGDGTTVNVYLPRVISTGPVVAVTPPASAICPSSKQTPQQQLVSRTQS